MTWRIGATITIFAVFLAGRVHADAPVNPPDWWGVNDGETVSLSYDFGTDAWPPIPDAGA